MESSFPTPHRAPLDVFKQAVRHFPLPSINLVVRNAHGEYLFVKRLNNPTKGEWWVPGGRILNGETAMEAARRVLREETGVDISEFVVSSEYIEELWGVDGFDADDWNNYDPKTSCVHYWATVAYAELSQEQTIHLDSQSSEARWSAQLLSDHPGLRQYFELLERMGVKLI